MSSGPTRADLRACLHDGEPFDFDSYCDWVELMEWDYSGTIPAWEQP